MAGRPQPDPISPSPLSQSQTLTRSVRVGMPPPVRGLLSYFSQLELDKKGGQPLRPHHPIWQRKVNRGNKDDNGQSFANPIRDVCDDDDVEEEDESTWS